MKGGKDNKTNSTEERHLDLAAILAEGEADLAQSEGEKLREYIGKILNPELLKNDPDPKKIEEAIKKINALYDGIKTMLANPSFGLEAQQELLKTLNSFYNYLNSNINMNAVHEVIKKHITTKQQNSEVCQQFLRNINEVQCFMECSNSIFLESDTDLITFDAQSILTAFTGPSFDDKMKQGILNVKLKISPDTLVEKQTMTFADYCHLNPDKMEIVVGNPPNRAIEGIPLYQWIYESKIYGDTEEARTQGVKDAMNALSKYKAYYSTDLYSKAYGDLIYFVMGNRIDLGFENIDYELLSNDLLSALIVNSSVDIKDIPLSILTRENENDITFITNLLLENSLENIDIVGSLITKCAEEIEQNPSWKKEIKHILTIALQSEHDFLKPKLQDIQAALDAHIITLNTIEEFASIGLITEELATFIKVKLSVETGSKPQIKQLYKYLIGQDLKVGEQRIADWMDQNYTPMLSDTKYRDFDILNLNAESKYSADQRSEIVKKGIKRDLKEGRKDDSVLNSVLNKEVLQKVLNSFVLQAFNEVISGISEETFTRILNNNISIGKELKHLILALSTDNLAKLLPAYENEKLKEQVNKHSTVNKHGHPVQKGSEGSMHILEYMSKHKSQVTKFKHMILNGTYTVEEIAKLDISSKDLIALLDAERFITVCNAAYIDGIKKHEKASNDISPVINAAVEIIKTGKYISRVSKIQSYVVKSMHDLQKISKSTAFLRPEDFKLALEKDILTLDDVAKWLDEGILTEDLAKTNVRVKGILGEGSLDLGMLKEKPLYEHLILSEINRLQYGRKMKVGKHRIAEKLDKEFGGTLVSSSLRMYRDFDTQAMASASYLTHSKTVASTIKHYIDLDIKEGRKNGSVLNALLTKERTKIDPAKAAELQAKMASSNRAEATKAMRDYNQLTQTLPEAQIYVLEAIMPKINEEKFKKIASQLDSDLIYCMVQAGIGIGSHKVHPLLAAPNDVIEKMVRNPDLRDMLAEARVSKKDGMVLKFDASQDEKGSINLLQYASQHKSQKETFKHLIASSVYAVEEIADMDIPSKKIIGLLKEGVGKDRIQDILSAKIENNKDIVNTMCELLAAGKNNPKLKDTYKEIYNECQKQIETKFKLTEKEKQQFNNLFGELTSNPRAVALFIKSDEFKQAEKDYGADKARMLLSYFVSKDFDEASKDLSTMRHLNTGHKELSSSMMQRMYDMLVDALLHFKRGKGEKFKHIQEKLDPSREEWVVLINQGADKDCLHAVATESGFLKAELDKEKAREGSIAIGGSRRA